MDKTIRVTLLVAVAFTNAVGQAMLEHSMAAGGASVGAVAGKGASDALNRLSGLLGTAATSDEPKKELVKEAKPEKAAPKQKIAASKVGPSAGAGATAIAVGSGVYFPEPRPVTQYQPRSQSAPVPVRAPEAMEPRQARNEDLARVEPGMSRSDVLAMGSFGSRITVPEDNGRMLEVLQYNGTTIRVEDGKVISVGHN
jgi:hypothetical protein